MIFNYDANKTHFHNKGFALSLVLKVRFFGTRKWTIVFLTFSLSFASLDLKVRNVPKLPGVDYVAKNWALAMMLKALPLVHFWSVLLLKEQMMTSIRKTLKTLV